MLHLHSSRKSVLQGDVLQGGVLEGGVHEYGVLEGGVSKSLFSVFTINKQADPRELHDNRARSCERHIK